FPRRGEICLVEFDPGRGREIKKTRPAVIIQNDIGNRHSPVTIVAAVTSKLSPTPYPVEVVAAPGKGNGLGAARGFPSGPPPPGGRPTPRETPRGAGRDDDAQSRWGAENKSR